MATLNIFPLQLIVNSFMALAGPSAGQPGRRTKSIAAIRHTISHGINWIDTAVVCGLGHSEEVVREALADIPADERLYVFTKCGLVWNEANHAAPHQVCSFAA